MNKRLLTGLRVLNTRPLGQAKRLNNAIVNAGGVSIDFPALAIKPTSVNWFDRLPNLSTINHAIFISPNAVNYFFKGLKKKDLAWIGTIQVTAVGTATAIALANWGIRVDHIPMAADSEHLLLLPSLQQVDGQTLLLIKGEGGRSVIAETLVLRNAHVISIDVYRRVLPKADRNLIHSLWHDDQVDIILFTSQQAIRHIFTLFGSNAKSWLCSKPCLVISKRLAEEAYAFGIKSVLICTHDTIISSLEKQVLNQGLIYDNQQK